MTTPQQPDPRCRRARPPRATSSLPTAIGLAHRRAPRGALAILLSLLTGGPLLAQPSPRPQEQKPRPLEQTSRPQEQKARPQQQTLSAPVRLAAPKGPTAILARADGTVLVSESQAQVQRLTVSLDPLPPAAPNAFMQPLPPFEAQWSPAPSPPRLLDGGAGTFLATDAQGERLVRVYPGRGGAEDIATGQGILTFAVHGTHIYFVSRAAPHVRRVLLRPPSLLGSAPVREADPVESLAYLPAALTDLVVIDPPAGQPPGPEVWVANATANSVQRVRSPAQIETRFTFPQAPTRLAASPDALFVGTRGGGVYRLDRATGATTRLAQLSSDITALALAGCNVLVGTDAGLWATGERAGGLTPLARGVTVSAVTPHGARVLFTNPRENDLAALPLPACVSPPIDSAAVAVQSSPAPAIAPPPPEKDTDALFGRSRSDQHTVVVTLLHARDDLAARIVKGRVTQVLASAHTEIWARASDAQIAALSRDGFWVAYRDGVDRVGCADIRRDPQAGRRALPAPFYEGAAPRVYLAQLDVPTHVLPGLADELAQHNLLLLESSGATLTLSASPTGIARLRRMPHVRWTAPYGVRERILSLAMSVLSQEVPCGDAGNAAGDGDGAMVGSTSTPDRTLRALADWIRREPKAPLPLTAVLFEDSASFRALVRSVGATAVQGTPGDPMITFTIPRHALPAIASHPALRVLEPYAEASIGLTTDSPRPVNGR